MKKIFQKLLDMQEGKMDFQTYHPTFTSAVSEAEKYLKKRGYEVSEEEWFAKISTGPRKPGRGKTNKYHLELLKNGKVQRKYAHIQVTNVEHKVNPYELNIYVS